MMMKSTGISKEVWKRIGEFGIGGGNDTAEVGEGGDPGREDAGVGQNPSPITDELKNEFSRIANAAQSNHSTRISKQFDKRLDEVTNAFSSQINELKEALLTAKNPEDHKGNKAKPQVADDAVAAVREEYNKKLEALQNSVQAAEKARQEEKEKGLRREERSTLTDALREKGVDGPLLKAAAAVLYTEEQRIQRNADGNIVFKMEADGYEQEFEVVEGVAKWLETDEGKSFKPPRPVSGSGMPQFNKGKHNPVKKKRSKAEALMELQSELTKGLF